MSLHRATPQVFSDTADGLVPASGGGTVNFLRADGAFAAPGGGGGGGFYREPVVAAGYYIFPKLIAVGTESEPNGVIEAVPIFVPSAITADRISCEVTGAGSGSVVRLGIYNSGANGLPSGLLLEAGTVSSDSTGVKEIAISQALSPGQYWLAGLIEVLTTNPTMRIVTATTNQIRTSFGVENLHGVRQFGLSTGSLPDPFPSALADDDLLLLMLRSAG